MGLSESKLTNKSEIEIPPSPENVPSTPTQCAKPRILKNLSEFDPRSPSDNILRTPLEILTTPYQSENQRTNFIQQAIDPRSPTDQFHRTPIIIKDADTEIPSKLHNKILDNVRRSVDYTPTLSSKTRSIPIRKSITPPKLLGSSPISRKTEKRKSFIGLLETNIDYTETDLDNYARIKSFNNTNLTITINENDLTPGILKCENCDPRSPTIDFLRTPIHIAEVVIGETDSDKTIDVVVSNDEKLEADPGNTGSLLKIVDDERKIIEEPVEINNEHLDDEKIPTEDSTSSEKMLEIVQDLIDRVEILTTDEKLELPEPIDLTADVQEFDRKLTKIIHEDDVFSFKKTPKRSQDENGRKRTPMKDRNLNEPKKNKLRVSDKPRKSEYAVSKIPVFREKNKVQCENTPPGQEIRRKRKSQPKWDSDKTLVI